MLAYTFGQVMWSMFVFFTWVLFFWLLFIVFTVIFRSHDMSGWVKALWVIFVIFLPFLGIFVYLIARGWKMHEHAVRDQQAADAAFRSYVQEAAGSSSSAADDGSTSGPTAWRRRSGGSTAGTTGPCSSAASRPADR